MNARSKKQLIAYWIVTIIVALESLAGGIADLLQVPGYMNVLKQLGYPAYFSIILGAGKIIAAFVILIPRFPVLKEWAYAGLVLQFTGAILSQIFVGNSATMLIAPFVFLCLIIASWWLRPPSRRI